MSAYVSMVQTRRVASPGQAGLRCVMLTSHGQLGARQVLCRLSQISARTGLTCNGYQHVRLGHVMWHKGICMSESASAAHELS